MSNLNNRTLLLVLGLLGVVVAAGATAWLLSENDDVSTGGPVVGETLPVEVNGAALPAFEDGATDPAVGMRMAELAGQRFDGTNIVVGGATDGPTMYVFLAHWCPACNDEIPELIDLDDRGDVPAGLDIIGISTAVAPDRPNYPPSRWIVEKDWPWDMMADDRVATSYLAAGGGGFPFSVLVDADGTVLARHSGSRSADDIQLWIETGLT